MPLSKERNSYFLKSVAKIQQRREKRIHTPHEVTAPGREDEGRTPDTVVGHISLLGPSLTANHLLDSISLTLLYVGDERVRVRDLRLCVALRAGEPGYGAKGQDEEEADQKTPPVAPNAVSS
jgi:hypothetical protein